MYVLQPNANTNLYRLSRGARDWYRSYFGIDIPCARFAHPSTSGRPSPIKTKWSTFQDGGQHNSVNSHLKNCYGTVFINQSSLYWVIIMLNELSFVFVSEKFCLLDYTLNYPTVPRILLLPEQYQSRPPRGVLSALICFWYMHGNR